MSAMTITPADATPRRTPRTSFVGLLRGELRKLRHLRIAWVTLAIITLFVIGGQLLLISGPTTSANLRANPVGLINQMLEGDVAIVRILSGVFILIVAAHVVGLEYQYGTIRVLLARGVGRLALLGAKVLALALVGLAVIALEALIELAFGVGLTLALADGGQPWSALGAEFWADMRIYAFYLVLNLLVSLLLSVAASVVGRSLAFGLAVGLGWFAVDSLLTIPLSLLARFTHSDLWLKLSTLLLGPLLNRLPDYIAPPYHVTLHGAHGPVTVTQTPSGFGPLPLLPVSGGHALLVIGVYSALFIAAAVILTWRRDVLE